MQHLGRPDPVEDHEARARRAIGARPRREAARPRRRRAGQTRSRPVPGSKHRVVERRYREEQRRPETSDRGEDGVRRRTTSQEDRRRAGPVRKREVVAQAVGVEQLRRREGHVVGRDPQHVPRVGLARVEEVAMQVDDSFRADRSSRSCRARRPRRRAASRLAGTPPRARARRRRNELRRANLLCARRVDDREPGAAVLDEVRIIVRSVQRIHRDRDGADSHRPEERRRKPRAVVHDEEHALATPDTEIAECRPRAAGASEELART